MRRMEVADTHYAITPDGVYIAYQLFGDGPIDVVWQSDWPGNIEKRHREYVKRTGESTEKPRRTCELVAERPFNMPNKPQKPENCWGTFRTHLGFCEKRPRPGKLTCWWHKIQEYAAQKLKVKLEAKEANAKAEPVPAQRNPELHDAAATAETSAAAGEEVRPSFLSGAARSAA